MTGKYLLVMELASKGNLLDYLRQKRADRYYPLSIFEVLNFAKQIALGMEHLASQNVIIDIMRLIIIHLCVCSVYIVIWQLGMC